MVNPPDRRTVRAPHAPDAAVRLLGGGAQVGRSSLSHTRCPVFIMLCFPIYATSNATADSTAMSPVTVLMRTRTPSAAGSS